MLFHSIVFLVGFLPIVLAGFFLIARMLGRGWAIAWMTLASLVFYGWGEAAHLFLLAASVVANYGVGRVIDRLRTADDLRHAKWVTAAGIVANLAVLGWFKYYNFFAENLLALMGEPYGVIRIVLPLAISFFTLQQIAYLVDVYRGRAEEHSFLHYALFVTFFPQLIAGPIVHHSEMLPQFRESAPFRFDTNDFAVGATIVLIGLFKKTVLADTLAQYADPVFAAAAQGTLLTFYEVWLGTLAFSFQIYFDFSAYSDIAIGLALMVSIRLPYNFLSPYRAGSIIEFWRCWHMTLSRFLRDYIYIPLGGNRRGPRRRYVYLMMTMLVGGLWHGAAWTFVIWGGLHGIYLSLNHFWRWLRIRAGKSATVESLAGRGISWLVTFFAVTVAWVFFRAESFDAAAGMLRAMAGLNGAALPAPVMDMIPALTAVASPRGAMPLLAGGTILEMGIAVGVIVLAAAVAFLFPNVYQAPHRLRLAAVAVTFGFTVHAILFAAGASSFIYFRF